MAKHRNGPTGMARLAFLDHFVKFANMAKRVALRPAEPGKRHWD